MIETLEQAIAHYADCMGCSLKEARQEAEATITLLMKQQNCERDFAEATFIEDTESMTKEELDQKDKEAKANGAIKVKKERKPRAKTKVERKPNEEKRELIQMVAELFADCAIVNPEREISFRVGENDYSLTLTCHRKKKEGA